MNDSALSDRSSGLTNGRLEGTSVPDLLWRLCQGRCTGVLKISAGDRSKSVFIDQGRIIFAASNDPDHRLGELFFRRNMITLEQLEQAVAQIGSGRRLGTILVENGAIGPQDLVQGVMDQVQAIIMSMFLLEEGEYHFEQGPLPSDEVITLSMKTAELLLQGIRKVRSFSRIRSSVGQPRVAYRLTPGWQEIIEGLNLQDGEHALLDRLDENGLTIEELCREVFLSNFEIYQALWAFKVLGVIEEAEFVFEGVGAASVGGQLGPEGLAPILVRLCRQGQTGVLHASRGTLERTFHICDGRCVFATSSNIDDGLVAHLLRRGVISLRDREETAKRLLSNKRVGVILREMGVIDDADLEIVVREQLSEIVFDTLRWEQGEYAFVAGELPTIEEITLDRSLEDLMLAGVRRVSSWSRIEGGCGGLDTPLVLSPEHENILDEMTVGPEEWNVVTAVRSPATLRDVCRESDLPDFLTCQVVWALKLLGIVVDADSVSAAAEERTAPAIEAPAEEPAVVETAPSVEPERPEPAVFGDDPSESTQAMEALEDSSHDEDLAASEPEVREADADDLADEPIIEDSPGSTSVIEATQYISREEIEKALGKRPGEGESDSEVDDSEIDFPDDEFEQTLTETQDDDVPVDIPVLADAQSSDDSEELDLDEIVHTHPGLTATTVSDEDDWQPPLDLEQLISRFNEMQRVVYRSIRTEVGAGAGNFVRSCGVGLHDPFGGLFADARLRPDGAWDPDDLKRAVHDRRVEEPWDGFRELIDQEIAKLQTHIGRARAASLRERLASLDRTEGQTALPPE